MERGKRIEVDSLVEHKELAIHFWLCDKIGGRRHCLQRHDGMAIGAVEVHVDIKRYFCRLEEDRGEPVTADDAGGDYNDPLLEAWTVGRCMRRALTSVNLNLISRIANLDIDRRIGWWLVLAGRHDQDCECEKEARRQKMRIWECRTKYVALYTLKVRGFEGRAT